MKNKYTENQLIEAFRTQRAPELGAAFVAKVMQSVETDSLWQPVFKFAAFNVCIASICAVLGFWLFDFNDISIKLIIDSGIVI